MIHPGFSKWIVTGIILLIAMDVNAQNNDGQSLDARQQSIVAISAATATGDRRSMRSRAGNQDGTTDKYEKGRKVLESLTKVPQAKPAPGFGEFAPL